MVSLNTILAIGGVGAAYLIFKNLGGAAGIGSSIGQGFNTFGTNIVAGLGGSLKNANSFDNPLNFWGAPKLDPNRGEQSYDDYINYKDDSGNTPTSPAEPDEGGWTPFIFPEANATPAQAPMFQYNSSNFFEQTPIEQRFPNARVATSSQKYDLRRLTGGLLG